MFSLCSMWLGPTLVQIMKWLISATRVLRTAAGLVAGGCLCLCASRAPAAEPQAPRKEYEPAKEEFAGLEKAVEALFQDRDVGRFARELTATVEDYRAVLSTNLAAEAEERLKRRQKSSDRERQKIEASAKAVLTRAEALHLDFSKGTLKARAITPAHFGSTHWDNLQVKRDSTPSTEKVELALEPTPNAATNGQYKVVLRGLIRFP